SGEIAYECRSALAKKNSRSINGVAAKRVSRNATAATTAKASARISPVRPAMIRRSRGSLMQLRIPVRRGECRCCPLEAVEHHQPSLARKMLGSRDDRLEVRRVQYYAERLFAVPAKFGKLVKNGSQFVLVALPAGGTETGSNLEHDGIDHRIAVEDREDSIQTARRQPPPDRPAPAHPIPSPPPHP